MKRALLIFVALGALVACGKSKTPATQEQPAPQAPGKGAAVVAHVQSAALGVTKDVVVYLPASYDTSGKRYPVFYYLHGLGGDETNWVKNGALDKTADALGLEAIVVMPDGDDGFYADSAKPIDYDACMKDGTGLFFPERKHAETCVHHLAYETYITKDLVSWVDATYRTIPKREARAIAGLSMGGFGALQLAMRHPDLFVAAASHSGVDSLLYAGPIPYEKGKAVLATDVDKWSQAIGEIGIWIRSLFGGDLENWKAHDPTTLATKLDKATAPALYIDCGTEDDFQLQHGMQYLHDILLERGIEHAYYLGPGRHNMKFWSVRVKNSLEFLRDKTAKPSA